MRRVGILVAALALAAGVAWGAGKAPAKSARSAAPNDSDIVLVRVGHENITRRSINERLLDIPEQYRATYQTPEGRQQILDRLIEERIWMQDAEAHDLAGRPDIARQLQAQRRDLLVRTWVNEVVSTNPPPSDSAAKAYYDEHRDDFKTPEALSMRHIQLKTEAEARKVLALAKAKDADWAKLVTLYSTDSLTRATGGSLGTTSHAGEFASLGPQPALAESAIALGKGQVGGPYHTNKGWHVIKVDSYQPEGMRDFEQVRTFILRTLTQQLQTAYYQTQLAKARARIGVTPDSSAIKSFFSSRKTARELFQEAQQTTNPTLRIEGYRKVVQEYPDADIAPQAQFMVGFVNSEELKNYDEAEHAFRDLLRNYPKSELATSAQWMVDHMRTEEAPNFPGADSLMAVPGAAKGTKK
ncbi:MAG TPA: peptidyl-prolyl cis-trans isomerase [Candidatus Acidoferrales bacterium]|nr:peptidyl-prolyl cis-trans isomerase [Candidatus Acidoferrales bacterium]